MRDADAYKPPPTDTPPSPEDVESARVAKINQRLSHASYVLSAVESKRYELLIAADKLVEEGLLNKSEPATDWNDPVKYYVPDSSEKRVVLSYDQDRHEETKLTKYDSEGRIKQEISRRGEYNSILIDRTSKYHDNGKLASVHTVNNNTNDTLNGKHTILYDTHGRRISFNHTDQKGNKRHTLTFEYGQDSSEKYPRSEEEVVYDEGGNKSRHTKKQSSDVYSSESTTTHFRPDKTEERQIFHIRKDNVATQHRTTYYDAEGNIERVEEKPLDQ